MARGLRTVVGVDLFWRPAHQMPDVFGENVPGDGDEVYATGSSLLDRTAVQNDARRLRPVGREKPPEGHASLPACGIRGRHLFHRKVDASPVLPPSALKPPHEFGGEVVEVLAP